MILPERVLGSSAVNTIEAGRAILPILLATWLRISLMRSSSPTVVPFRVQKAAMAWPVRSSARPTTAASATAGWSTRADSTSSVEIRCPEMFITSSTRPRSQK